VFKKENREELYRGLRRIYKFASWRSVQRIEEKLEGVYILDYGPREKSVVVEANREGSDIGALFVVCRRASTLGGKFAFAKKYDPVGFGGLRELFRRRGVKQIEDCDLISFPVLLPLSFSEFECEWAGLRGES